MIDKLKPYPTMKVSSVPCLGEVPEHWTERRAKYFYREADDRSETGNEELLSVSHKTGVTPRKQNVTMFLSESTIGYKICRPGDIAINTMWAFMGALGIARQVGLVSPAYGIYRPQRSDELNPEYLDRLLRIDVYKSEYMCRSTGINSSRLRLYPDEFLRIPIICPPLPEQAAIVRFLDHADRKIRRYIRAKQKLIKLLEEQKQAIIHRAVTRGLNPNVPLKDSGISWLGEIPGHWEVVPVGAISILLQTGPFGSQLHQSDYISGGIPVINPSHMVDGRIAHDPEIGISAEMAAVLSRHAIKPDDILIARRGDLGRCALVSSREDGWVCGTGSMLLRCRKNMILPKFFRIIFSSSGIAEELQLSSIGATMANLNEGVVARQRIPLPTLEDQAMIIDWIASKARTIEVSMSSIANEIILLREYRTSLIADVVTGKLDVRQVAAGLPEEAMDDELIEDEGLEDLEAGEEDLDLIDDADG